MLKEIEIKALNYISLSYPMACKMIANWLDEKLKDWFFLSILSCSSMCLCHFQIVYGSKGIMFSIMTVKVEWAMTLRNKVNSN